MPLRLGSVGYNVEFEQDTPKAEYCSSDSIICLHR
eukprot:COSAG05_NODE_26467_length_188_cov_18.168539_1_plen_34_part_01